MFFCIKKQPCLRLFLFILLLYDTFLTRRVEGVIDFPLIHILANAVGIGLLFDGDFALRPLYQTFEINFVTSTDYDVGNFL